MRFLDSALQQTRQQYSSLPLRIRKRLLLSVLFITVLIGQPCLGEVIGDVVRVGYLLTTGTAIRIGTWTPVVVDLTLQNQTSFDGKLLLRQFDRDGDVYIDSVPVHLFGESSRQRYWLYTIANPDRARRGSFAVELLETSGEDDPGRRAKMISGGVPVSAITPPVDAQVFSHDKYLILAVSDGSAGSARFLVNLDADHEQFDRPVEIAHVSPTSLPGKWIGLQMLDCVIWDAADPTVLTPEQEHALVEWVHQGGKLVLAAARTSDAIVQSEILGPLLPVKVGNVKAESHFPNLRREMLGLFNDDQQNYSKPVTLAHCTIKKHDDVTCMLQEDTLGTAVVAKRRLGRGQLIFVAGELAELVPDNPANAIPFYKKLLELRRERVSLEKDKYPIPMIRWFDQEVAFSDTTGAYLALAVFFAIIYVLVATLGVWKVLQTRKLLKYSWSALGLTAVITSVLSIIGVQALHGVGSKVEQLSIIDGVVGQDQALATAYFGLTTSMRSTVDVWLPADSVLDKVPGNTVCTLAPMLSWRDFSFGEAKYTDPTQYTLRPATAEIHNVPMRATLKQFEGRWSGTLFGMVKGQLGLERIMVPRSKENPSRVNEWVITRDSWIENQLGIDLSQCYLLVSRADPFAPQTFTEMPRATVINVFRLGSIKNGDKIRLFDLLYTDPATGDLLPKENRQNWDLSHFQKSWGNTFARAADTSYYTGEEIPQKYNQSHYQNAIMIVTSLADVELDQFRAAMLGVDTVPRFSSTRCRQLDLSDLLDANTAILVGFSNGAGPARLHARTGGGDYEPVKLKKANTVYRFLMPVEVKE